MTSFAYNFDLIMLTLKHNKYNKTLPQIYLIFLRISKYKMLIRL